MKKIVHFLKLASLTVSLLVLSSCGSGGGGGGGAPSPTSTQLSGVASKGPIVNGTVTAFSIINGQKGGVLASTTSGSSGNYTLNLGAYTGPVLLEVTGGSYKDEATGTTVSLASTLRSAIANVIPNKKSGTTKIVSASVTPLTEAAVQNAEAGAGGLTPTNIQTANDDVKAQVGFDPVSTQPADATNPATATASIAAKTYAVLLGTVSQYLKDNPSKSLDNAESDFAIAFKAGGNGLADPLITAAVNNFGANANNQTGVSSVAALQTLKAPLATLDDEDPVSQRTVAAALFNDSSVLACGADSVTEYPNTCSVKFNHNLSGMPGCFGNLEDSNYISNNIGHYQKINVTGLDWKTSGFSCANSSYENIYADFVWSMNDGRVMNGTHNGIDFVHNGTNPQFYAIAPGVVIYAGAYPDTYNTIAIYLADPTDPTNRSKGITTLYLHASSVNVKIGDSIKPGDPLGHQGNTGLIGTGKHVHISVRIGQSICACHDEPNGYLPPVATLLTYLAPASTATPSVSSVSPTSMSADGLSHTLVITGSNFASGNVVQFKWGQGAGANVWTTGSTPTVTPSQITVNMLPGSVTDAIYVRVCSSNGSSNCSGGTQFVSVTAHTVTLPAAPSGISAIAGNGQATVSWNTVSGATSYNLYRASVSGVTKSNYSSLTGGVKSTGVTSPYIQTSLTNGTPYYFVVTAVNANGESSESSQVSAAPQASGVAPYTVTEFSVGISAGAYPLSITAGPDGNLWFTEYADAGNRIGRITPSGVVTEFSLPSSLAKPTSITAGPDGNLWFIESGYNGWNPNIGRITPTGVVTEFSLGGGTPSPSGIVAGPDGNLWITLFDYIARMTTDGVETFVPILHSFEYPSCIAVGHDGNLWYTEGGYGFTSTIARMTTGGTITEFGTGINSGGGFPCIAAGPDGNLWFTAYNDNLIGRLTPAGVATQFSAGISAGAKPYSITAGPDGNLWFTEPGVNQIGRITPAGVVTEFSAGISAGAGPTGITAGPDGNIWFTEPGLNRIGRITP